MSRRVRKARRTRVLFVGDNDLMIRNVGRSRALRAALSERIAERLRTLIYAASVYPTGAVTAFMRPRDLAVVHTLRAARARIVVDRIPLP